MTSILLLIASYASTCRIEVRHLRQRSKRGFEPLDAAPQHRLVAVDDGLAERALDVFDRLDLSGVGAAQENALRLRSVVFASELRPFARGDRGKFKGLEAEGYVMDHGKSGRAEIVDHSLVAPVRTEQQEAAQAECLQCFQHQAACGERLDACCVPNNV
jgi:hypothetical protein